MSPHALIRRNVDRDEASKRPEVIWNAYVDLCFTEKYEDLSPVQQVAHLAFRYDAEINNGGHFQYFENSHSEYAEETVLALERIGAPHLAAILVQAMARFMSRPREHVKTVAEFCAGALEGEYDDLDRRYGMAQPTMDDLLQVYLDKHVEEFIKWV